MKVQPSKGSFFPIGVGEVFALTKEWGLTPHDGHHAPVKFQNSEPYAEGVIPLVQLWPGLEFAIFSLPEDIDRDLARAAVVKAIGICDSLSQMPRLVTAHVARSFVVRLDGLATLVVVDRRVHFQPRKYRSGSGSTLSNALKPRVIKTEESELRRVSLQASA